MANVSISNDIIDGFYNAGYSFIPTDQNKKPLVKTWTEHQNTKPDFADINRMPFSGAHGIATICGKVAGVGCIDVDTKNDPDGGIDQRYFNAIQDKRPELFKRLYIESTPSGGAHILYKCATVPGNKILAKKQAKPIIETRGEGGYCVVWPTPGYNVVQGDIFNLPEISPEDQRFLFEEALAFNQVPEIRHKPANRSQAGLEVLERLKDLLQQAQDQQLDVAASYYDWITAGHALARDFGEDGRELFLMISWDSAEGSEVYDSILRSVDREYHGQFGPVSVRTIFYRLAREFGIYPPSDNKDKIQICEDRFLKEGIRYNEILGRNELPSGQPLTDRITNSWYLDIVQDTRISKELFLDILNSNRVPSFNPLRDKFTALRYRHFEGSPLEKFLSHLKVKDWIFRDGDNITAIDPIPYVKKWLLSVVASAFGRISEIVLVLISQKHGTGKTEFFMRLLPEDLEDYATISSLDQAKDSDITMTQKLIILDDEYRGKSKTDAGHFKAKVSQKVFTVRRPYGRHNEDLRRIAVLCGACNEPQILNDGTGNRRVVPVTLVSRDFEISDSIDRNDLWADITQQYFQAVEAGDTDPYKLNWEDYKLVELISEESQFINPERELIERYFAPGGSEFLSATEILDHIVSTSETSIKLSPIKVGIELNLMGFVPHRSKTKRGFFVKKLDG